MKIILQVLFFILPTLAWALPPNFDPVKYTVCAMTLNSGNERRIFEEQVLKHPTRYNPVIELTDMGGPSDWFERACASGIRCDQLVISGHFAAGFSGSSGKKLPLKTMEKTGCSASCDGIMNHPYEVFLFGCNTLAGKAPDRRTPDEYLNHLMDEGVNRYAAEMTVEARYGKTGDSFKTRIQRSFGKLDKNLYGFDSIGPAGNTIEERLRQHFRVHPIDKQLGIVQARRFLGTVNSLNTDLAQTLRITAFEQCVESAGGPEDRVMCQLLNDKMSVNQKLSVIQSALTSSDWIKFIPTINSFFKDHPVTAMTSAQKAEVAEIGANPVISRQIKNLMTTTKSLLVQNEWVKLGRSLGIATAKEQTQILSAKINGMLAVGLTSRDADLMCSLATDLSPYFHPSGNPSASQNSERGLACLTK